MKLEATKFRPREVVRHVLQTAAASLKKMLTLEGHIADDVPVEVRKLPCHMQLKKGVCHAVDVNPDLCVCYVNQVIGDVLRIRQILTNLVR